MCLFLNIGDIALTPTPFFLDTYEALSFKDEKVAKSNVIIVLI